MLTWRCRRFRARFTPGLDDPHRRRCRACDDYAAAIERAAAAGRLVPISDRLRRRLESIPASSTAPVLPFPLPGVPLPDRLRQRLQGIPRSSAPPRRPPTWVLDPRYAVAASYLLAVFLTLALGDPMTQGRRAVTRITQSLERPFQQAETEGRHHLRSLEDLTSTRYVEARHSFTSSLQTLSSRVTEISRELIPETMRRSR